MVSLSNIVSHTRAGGSHVPDTDELLKEFAGVVSQDKVRSCVVWVAAVVVVVCVIVAVVVVEVVVMAVVWMVVVAVLAVLAG